jgi:hypothetical protein
VGGGAAGECSLGQSDATRPQVFLPDYYRMPVLVIGVGGGGGGISCDATWVFCSTPSPGL